MDDKAYLLIGDVKCELIGDDDKLTVKNKINYPRTFEVTMGFESLSQFNYNDPIKIFVCKDGKEHILFNGNIKSSKQGDSQINMFGADALEQSKELTISLAFREFKPQDVVYHLVKSINLVPEIQDTFFDGKMLKFRIVIPIKNIKLKTSDVEFNGVKLSGKPEESIFEILKTSKLNTPFVAKGVSFALVEVEAVDFIEAHSLALKQIEKFIDWISYLRNFSLSQFDGERINWNETSGNSLPMITDWFYGEIIGTNYKLIMDSKARRTSEVLDVTEENECLFSLCREGFEEIYMSNWEDLINAIHWLRRAREMGNVKDKLLDYFTSMEFLVNGQKTKKIFTKNKHKEVLKLVETALDEEEYRRFKEHFGMINSPSFKMRLYAFISENSVPISSSEEKHLEKMRRARNLLEHGKGDVEVSGDDLRVLGNIVEKLVLYCIMGQRKTKPDVKKL